MRNSNIESPGNYVYSPSDQLFVPSLLVIALIRPYFKFYTWSQNLHSRHCLQCHCIACPPPCMFGLKETFRKLYRPFTTAAPLCRRSAWLKGEIPLRYGVLSVLDQHNANWEAIRLPWTRISTSCFKECYSCVLDSSTFVRCRCRYHFPEGMLMLAFSKGIKSL